MAQSVTSGQKFSKKFHFFYSLLQLSDDFKKFDYGYFGNLIKYGKLRPPVYNLANVQVHAFLSTSNFQMYLPLFKMYAEMVLS